MAAGGAICILLSVVVMARPGFGQFTEVHVPEGVPFGESINMFATWGGVSNADGFLLGLPQDWDLESVAVVENAFRSVPASIDSLGYNRYRIHLEEKPGGQIRLVFRIRGRDSFEVDRASLTPFTLGSDGAAPRLDEASRVTATLYTTPPRVDPENRVASFAAPDIQPLIFRRDAVPVLDLDRAFSLSLWFKTTGLNEVLFSTWNGEEHVEYPVELVVGPGGGLRAFRGRPGHHQSMSSEKPVADGRWHHVVLLNEPASGWMRLHVDGRGVDSLYSATPPNISMALPPVIGGRTGGPEAYFDGARPYSGYVDAFRIHHVQAPGARQERRDNTSELEIDFENPVPPGMLAEPAPLLLLTKSDLSFRSPVDDFSVTNEDGVVVLRWRASEVRPSAGHARGASGAAETGAKYVVERSRDGYDFEIVYQVRDAARAHEYEFRDTQAGDGVVFYRLKQRFPDGGERLSATIKVGMGSGLAGGVRLVGNFPNPFNSTTTIRFVVEEQADVSLSVWDVSGQAVRRVLDRSQAPGIYEVQFNADDLPSGTYFVRLQTASGIESHQMVLMR